MSAIKGAVHWAGEHPVTTAVGVFAVGAVILLILKPGAAPAGDNGMSAFYAAQAAQSASGNSLMAIQAQGKAATAIAQISADRDTHIADTASAANIAINTVQAQTDLGLAGINADVLNNAELTRQQAQKQQFFLATGQQQIEGQALPYFLQQISGGGASANAAVAAWQALIAGGGNYSPAH